MLATPAVDEHFRSDGRKQFIGSEDLGWQAHGLVGVGDAILAHPDELDDVAPGMLVHRDDMIGLGGDVAEGSST